MGVDLLLAELLRCFCMDGTCLLGGQHHDGSHECFAADACAGAHASHHGCDYCSICELNWDGTWATRSRPVERCVAADLGTGIVALCIVTVHFRVPVALVASVGG